MVINKAKYVYLQPIIMVHLFHKQKWEIKMITEVPWSASQYTRIMALKAPSNMHGYSLSHRWTLWWRVWWLEQWRLQVTAELQQRWRRTNRRQNSIPCSSCSHREGSITKHGASCGGYNQRRHWSTPKTPTWINVGSQVDGLSKVWWHRAFKATICENV